jgi:hypothetical protein
MMGLVYFVLSGTFLQPHTMLIAYFFTSLFAGVVREHPDDRAL